LPLSCISDSSCCFSDSASLLYSSVPAGITGASVGCSSP
jgi:hypothetical protein